MGLLYEIRRQSRYAVAPVLCAAALGYFGYHAVNGDRGLTAWLRHSQEIAGARSELAALQAERQGLERRVAALGSAGLDRDMLDERARYVLGLAHADEVVFVLK